MAARATANHEPQFDRLSSVLDLFDGDANATVTALLAELQFVRGQLALCEAGMSVGFTRGWVPTFDSEGASNV